MLIVDQSESDVTSITTNNVNIYEKYNVHTITFFLTIILIINVHV